MASAQEACMVRLEAEAPSGNVVTIFEKRVEALAGGGNSSDGTISISYEKWPVMPLVGPRLGRDTKLRFKVKLDAADGIDTSDSKLIIPFRKPNGSTSQLTQADFGLTGTTYDLPASTTAGVWHQYGSEYTITDTMIQIGGDKSFMSVEDDTA